MDEQIWQPVRVAPPPKHQGHLHPETIAWMKENQGKIIHVTEVFNRGHYCRSFDVLPEERSIFEGFEQYGNVIGVCLCQILAD